MTSRAFSVEQRETKHGRRAEGPIQSEPLKCLGSGAELVFVKLDRFARKLVCFAHPWQTSEP
ncbi:hypothetical protein J2R76_003653 [Bradyrhizobium sp. USDA 4532]|nr:hypothetical protein [Bradyrhizobium sp. USDA 4545]MCP1920062.1 hypothetical protein [Bradyrhizobium sp. USDA 4532]